MTHHLYVAFLIVSSYLLCCHGDPTITNVVPGVYGTKRQSDGLQLPATGGDFQPITALTTCIQLAKPAAVMVHYQVTVDRGGTGHDLWTKLQVNHITAGSLLHTGTLQYQTATGYWMGNLNPGEYTIEVFYKSSKSISMSTSLDYQTAVVNVMWFDDMTAVSNGVKCTTKLNIYNILSPVRDLEMLLTKSSSGTVLAAYQFSINSPSQRWFTAKMNMNDQQLPSTNMINDLGNYLDYSGLWMKHLSIGEYYFGLTYRTSTTSNFVDCQNNYKDNKNLYAMSLPSKCRIIANVKPTSSLFLSTSWQKTDLTTTFTLSQTSHIIIRYQFSRYTSLTSYTATRLLINSVAQPHTASIKGVSYHAGQSGMWQGSLLSGRHTVTVEHRGSMSYNHYVGDDHHTRAMNIVACY